MTHRVEQLTQQALCEHLRLRAAPGVFWAAYPSGGYRRKAEAAIMRSTGTVAGFPDLFFVKAGQLFALELKTPAGRLSARQVATHQALRQAGAQVETAYNIDAALAALERWQLLRRADG